MAITSAPRKIFFDLLDKGASTSTSKISLNDAPASVLLVVNTLVGLSDAILHLTNLFVANVVVFTPVISWCVTVCIASIIVCAKVARRAIGPAIQSPVIEYRYAQFLRIPAKLVLLIAVTMLPLSVENARRVLAPVPSVFGGYLVEASSGVPISDARVHLIQGSGREFDATAPSDVTGFYTFELAHNSARDASLWVAWTGCATPVVLSLARTHEIGMSPSGAPIFRHYLICAQ